MFLFFVDTLEVSGGLLVNFLKSPRCLYSSRPTPPVYFSGSGLSRLFVHEKKWILMAIVVA